LNQLLTAEQVAERTQLCPATIRRLCARGQLRATKLAGKWRIAETDYVRWLEAGEPEPGVARPKTGRRMASPASSWQLRAINGGAA
jgi:excisionase family DNA binding protein